MRRKFQLKKGRLAFRKRQSTPRIVNSTLGLSTPQYIGDPDLHFSDVRKRGQR